MWMKFLRNAVYEGNLQDGDWMNWVEWGEKTGNIGENSKTGLI